MQKYKPKLGLSLMLSDDVRQASAELFERNLSNGARSWSCVMPEQSELLEYQDALLELLSSGLPQSTILETLATDPRFEPYRDYVKQFDPDMVAVACELMGKWAKRK